MNAKQESALILADGRAADAKYLLLENTRWTIALFKAIEHSRDEDHRCTLASIGKYIADRGWANADAELDQLKAELATLREVAA